MERERCEGKVSAGCGDGVRLQGIRAPSATLPAPQGPARPPQGAPWASVTGSGPAGCGEKENVNCNGRPSLRNRKGREKAATPRSPALRGACGFLEENSVASHGPWFGMCCQLDRIGKALTTCHEHHVVRPTPAAVVYLLRTARGGHHSPVAMPFPRSPGGLAILQPNSSPPWLARLGAGLQGGSYPPCLASPNPVTDSLNKWKL